MRLIVISSALLISILLFAGCGQNHPVQEINEYSFPELRPLSNLQHTSFVPCLDNDAPTADNVIYTPAFLYAWDELKHTLGNPFTLQKADKMLQEVNEATSFRTALSKGEYETNVKTNETSLTISASFKKSLPFMDAMDTVNAGRPFSFAGYPVRSFGMPDFDEKIAKHISVLYYRNDDHFIIRIIPKDTTQEIILAKGLTTDRNLKGMLKEADKLISIGTVEQKSSAYADHYRLNFQDQVVVPVLCFNLEKNYRNFIGACLHLPVGSDTISAATQRTAFVLDEHGTKVATEAHVVAEAAPAAIETAEQPEEKRNKLLWLNRPFVVILRKKGVDQPYLMMKIENTELMVKR